MKKITDYIKKYNYDFTEQPFNLIDNIILSQISYINFNKIDFYNNITIEEANNLFKKIKDIKNKSTLQKEVYEMLNLLSKSKRFKDSKLINYKKILSNKKQFGAVTILLNDNTKYISFEGTDGSLIGWKENFVLAYSYPTETQKSAIKYLNQNIKLTDKNVKVGGHSKGGNLAMSAYLNCHFYLKNKITNVYNNDGPGFRKEEFNSLKYKELANKLTTIVPNQSIVGMLLLHSKNYIVVKSSSIGIYAHDAFSWMCEDNNLIEDELFVTSKHFEEVIEQWFLKLTKEELQVLVNTIFEVMEVAGINNTNDVQLDNMIKLTKDIKNIDPKTKNAIIEILTLLKDITKENILKPINKILKNKEK